MILNIKTTSKIFKKLLEKILEKILKLLEKKEVLKNPRKII